MTTPLEQTAAMPAPGPDFRAILLDDSDCDRRHAVRVFARLGLPLDTVAGVGDFFRRLGEVRYHLALVDHHLGADSGLEVLARLAGADRAPGMLVLLTGAEDPRVADEAMALGCAACLGKDRLGVAAVADLLGQAGREDGR